MQTLKEAREGKGVKKGAVAGAIDVTYPTYQRYESGESVIPEDKLKCACDFIGVDVKSISKRRISFFELTV